MSQTPIALPPFEITGDWSPEPGLFAALTVDSRRNAAAAAAAAAGVVVVLPPRRRTLAQRLDRLARLASACLA